jgi:glucose 1-dehydrogenase
MRPGNNPRGLAHTVVPRFARALATLGVVRDRMRRRAAVSRPLQLNLRGRRAVVTGANSGIGRAIALELGREGARVWVSYVTAPEAADAVVAEIAASGGTAVRGLADVSDPGQVARMFAHVERTWGGVDILIHCAGINGPCALAWDQNPDDWRRVIAINLTGAYLCAREALRRMVPQRDGVILNITSVHERIPWSGYSAYTASKAALGMLTKTLAQEAAPHGVRVLALAPGSIQTPLNPGSGRRDDVLRMIPLGRKGQPEDVARVATVLVSDLGAYVTGTTVVVDGGLALQSTVTRGGG